MSAHCDPDIVHAPEEECVYCNRYPELQQKRIDKGINFTGQHDENKATCPAEIRRPLERINLWHGNRAMTQEDIDQEAVEWAAFWEEQKRLIEEFENDNR